MRIVLPLSSKLPAEADYLLGLLLLGQPVQLSGNISGRN